MKPGLRRVLPLVAAALLLSACQLQSTTEIKPDGSGELRTEVGFTAQERQNLENQSGGNSSQNFCNVPASQGQTPADITVTEEQRGDETWCVTTTKFDNLDELRRLYEKNKGLTINRLEIADGKFYYDVDVDTSSKESSYSSFTAVTWTIILPGMPIDHNAAQAHSNTLTWTLVPHTGVVNLHAASAVERANSNLLLAVGGLIVLGLLGIALAGGAGVLYWRRRSRKPGPGPAARR